MTAIMAFLARDYLRSYRFLPPIFAYAFVIFFVYSIVPNPVMDSYAFSSVWTFVAMAWFSYGYMDAEHETQQQLTCLYAGGIVRYLAAKLLLMFLLGLGLSVLAVVYPIAFDKFDHVPSWSEAAIGLLAHATLALLGAACAAPFTDKLIGRRAYAIMGLLLVVVLAVGGHSLEAQLPAGARFAVWLIPPVFRVMDLLVSYDGQAVSVGGVWVALLPLAYVLIVGGAFLYRMKRKLL